MTAEGDNLIQINLMSKKPQAAGDQGAFLTDDEKRFLAENEEARRSILDDLENVDSDTLTQILACFIYARRAVNEGIREAAMSANRYPGSKASFRVSFGFTKKDEGLHVTCEPNVSPARSPAHGTKVFFTEEGFSLHDPNQPELFDDGNS